MPLVTKQQLAKELGVSKRTIELHVYNYETFSPAGKNGRSKLFDLDECVEKHRRFRADRVLYSNVPSVASPGIYLLFLNDGLVYVGQSAKVLARIKEHRRNGRTFDRAAFGFCRDYIERLRLERWLIETYRPAGNRQYAKGA